MVFHMHVQNLEVETLYLVMADGNNDNDVELWFEEVIFSDNNLDNCLNYAPADERIIVEWVGTRYTGNFIVCFASYNNEWIAR